MNGMHHRADSILNMLRSRAIGFALLASAVLAGCAQRTVSTTTSTVRPLPPEPRSAPVTPAGVKADRMVFAVGSKPEDTDGNGYPDRIDATVMLFAQRYPTPMFVDGTFEFTLYASGQANNATLPPIAQWIMSGEAVERAKHSTTIGPQYRFALSLRESGTDQLPLALADLSCTFIPAHGSTDGSSSDPANTSGGQPVMSDGVRSIQVGRAVAGR